METPAPWLRRLILTGATCLIGLLLFLAAMDRDLNHDEHQFIAPGVLIAREGLVPYRDFPIFHLPNLAYVYAGLDRILHNPVLAAKLVSVASTTGMMALILVAASFGTAIPRPAGFALTAAVAILLLGDQLFVFTTGKTWNHELPASLLIAAIVLQVLAVERAQAAWLLASGLCLGIAVGTRITYLPIAGAFLVTLLLTSLPRRLQLLGGLSWSSGFLVGLAPTFYHLVANWDSFYFDNFQFPRLRLLDASDSRVQKTVTLWRKVRFFGKEIIAHSIPLVVAAMAMMWRPLRVWWKTRAPETYGVVLVAAALPATLIGCFLPSRYQYQHFYAVAPLLALGLAYAIRHWQPISLWHRQPALLVGICVIASLGSFQTDRDKPLAGVRAYSAVPSMWNFDNWFSTRLRKDYAFASTIEGRILTLAPAGVLQGGGRIYPEFATGPFAWRGARLLNSGQRIRHHLAVPEDLESFLKDQPPAAILTGVEDKNLEEPLLAYAAAHHYFGKKVSKRRTLWLPPR